MDFILTAGDPSIGAAVCRSRASIKCERMSLWRTPSRRRRWHFFQDELAQLPELVGKGKVAFRVVGQDREGIAAARR